MQMVKKIFLGVALIWFGATVFMPKKELYYKLEEMLAKKDIRINGETIKEGLFSLDVHHPTVSVKGINIATIEKIKLFTLLFSSEIKIQNVVLDKSLRETAPGHIEVLTLKHALLSLFGVSLDANCDFGAVEGEVNLKERKLHIDLIGAKNIQAIQSRLRQNEKGWYYETSF
ncbi:MAG TPA: hypothetical protein CFH81_06650 [Sulfurovum sp. UBA12169]|nr:MAG TPA: hypothetical protein CFH81_06650 [Sulfurovum sp. UBA12169]